MPQQENEFQPHERAYFVDEKVHCLVLSRGAYFSLVRYSKDGMMIETPVENGDLIFNENEDD